VLRRPPASPWRRTTPKAPSTPSRAVWNGFGRSLLLTSSRSRWKKTAWCSSCAKWKNPYGRCTVSRRPCKNNSTRPSPTRSTRLPPRFGTPCAVGTRGACNQACLHVENPAGIVAQEVSSELQCLGLAIDARADKIVRQHLSENAAIHIELG